MSLTASKIRSTYKSEDTEEFLDKIFYRPIGYGMAVVSKSLGLTPNAVTFISIIFGVAAGHLFFYQDVQINLIGVFLLITSEAMDAADGQLARMTNIHSRYGKIFDGVAGNLMFVSIYLHMSARFIIEGGTVWILGIAVISGLSHSFQSAMSEYYRNFYLYFTTGKNIGGIDELEDVQETYNSLSWFKDIVKKALLRLYINYTVQQRTLSKSILNLYKYVVYDLKGVVPKKLMTEYRKFNKPMIKYGSILTTNTRMGVLIFTIFYANIFYYFLFELVVLNLLLLFFTIKEEKISSYLLNFAKKLGNDK